MMGFLTWSKHKLAEALSAGCYVDRPVLNADVLEAWCRTNHIAIDITPASKLHCTVLYSVKDIRYHPDFRLDAQTIEIQPSQFAPRLQTLGDMGTVVLKFQSVFLHHRWTQFLNLGALTTYPTYAPHISLARRGPGSGWKYTLVKPPTFSLHLGPERVWDLK